ncbi:MAG: BamA/TamA family outer membrane protein [Deltaproteobacteria bacterium]|nr:BamA/TamA family outer membrane protein [Deltaproteobacteria bacterium]
MALVFLASGCGTIIPDLPNVIVTNQRLEEADRLLQSDPEGPIPSPNIPAGLRGQVEPASGDGTAEGKITYSVKVTAPDQPPGLVEAYEKVCNLNVMKDRPLNSRLTLMGRLRSSIEQGQALLGSWGYYEGRAEGKLEDGPTKGSYVASIELFPGPLYSLAPGQVIISNSVPLTVDPNADPKGEDIARELAQNMLPAEDRVFCPTQPGRNPCPADNLEMAGLKPGAPAKADDVLAVVANLVDIWKDHGYPAAEVTASKYSIDTAQKTLHSEIVLTPGAYVKMGQMVITGDDSVERRYLQNLVNWKEGQDWNQDLVELFREAVMQTGLFKSVEVSRGYDEDQNGNTPVTVALEPAPRRTVSGSLNYDTDWGPGISVSWENRNFSGWGDRFKIEMPIWEDLAQLGVTYQRPYVFNNPRYSLLAETYLLREKSDNYSLLSGSVSVGVERIINSRLRARLQTSVEFGDLDDYVTERTRYRILGLPFSLYWNNSDNFLNPTKGIRASFLLSPYVGHYFKNFKLLKARADFNFYQSILGGDKVVAALRLAAGTITGSSPESLPSSLRFFGGGGQSVRGYEYQSIGPKNARGRPAGGSTMAEVSTELRFRWSETMGAVAFVDGGMVYNPEDVTAIGRDFLWGGGLGFRYYSPIGPFRLDLATPLTPREDDSKLQIYLSLGQSF